MTGHVTTPAAALADQLPTWVTLLRAPNPGPLTLDGTNTWVLRAPGGTEAVVVDPGPLDAGHLAAIAEHAPISLILITHGHPDHVDGVEELSAAVGAPARGLVDGRAVAEPSSTTRSHPGDTGLRPGDIFILDGLEITVLATPGHTADSACFLVEHAGEQVVLTGDTILGRGTTVITQPDGDLGDYLDSLDLLSAYDGVPVLPGHGPALADCGAAARFYLAHRHARLDQVRQARDRGARTASEVVAMVYADVDRSLWPAAEWSVHAQLAYLERQDRESPPGVVGLDTL
ncbi:MAG TPA: MBL fold metallo-hydrolase [Micromonospora sp.]|nr:MBL fold metallo-hydrolase [Micromonospora sp.]